MAVAGQSATQRPDGQLDGHLDAGSSVEHEHLGPHHEPWRRWLRDADQRLVGQVGRGQQEQHDPVGRAVRRRGPDREAGRRQQAVGGPPPRAPRRTIRATSTSRCGSSATGTTARSSRSTTRRPSRRRATRTRRTRTRSRAPGRVRLRCAAPAAAGVATTAVRASRTPSSPASSDQSAHSSATSEQDHPSNVNIPVRIGSSGDDGRVTQINSSSAVSAAGNKNTTDQTVDQSAGGSGSGSAVQYADQKAGNKQDATSDATSHQSGASNANYPVRIGSPGGGGSVTQVNASVGHLGGREQERDERRPPRRTPAARSSSGAAERGCSDKCGKSSNDGCSDKCGPPSDGCRDKCGGGSGPVVQDAKQKAYNDQTADSSAESTQCCAQNTNAPVRIKSYGDDGDVKQANLSGAISAAGNKNDTTQYATQDAGSGPVEMVRLQGRLRRPWRRRTRRAAGRPERLQRPVGAFLGRLDPEGREQLQRPRSHQERRWRRRRHPGQRVAAPLRRRATRTAPTSRPISRPAAPVAA